LAANAGPIPATTAPRQQLAVVLAAEKAPVALARVKDPVKGTTRPTAVPVHCSVWQTSVNWAAAAAATPIPVPLKTATATAVAFSVAFAGLVAGVPAEAAAAMQKAFRVASSTVSLAHSYMPLANNLARYPCMFLLEAGARDACDLEGPVLCLLDRHGRQTSPCAA
jgi:hypothetical protein